MCFQVPRGAIKKIAEQHLLVFKKLDASRDPTQGRSPFRGFVYTFGKLVKTKLGAALCAGWGDKVIYEGLHSYRRGYDFIDRHPAVIPKGSEYYINRSEVVSNQLVVFRNWEQLAQCKWITNAKTMRSLYDPLFKAAC